MSIIEGLVAYFMIWWVVIFTTLPFGIEKPENHVPGQMHGAPKDHGLKKKFIYTTLISFLVWLIVFFIINIELIDFYEIAEAMSEEDEVI
jgi:predicted secreted protein